MSVVHAEGKGLAATRLIESMLFDVAPNDAATIAASAVFLLLVATFAAYLPARRASRVDAMAALRHN